MKRVKGKTASKKSITVIIIIKLIILWVYVLNHHFLTTKRLSLTFYSVPSNQELFHTTLNFSTVPLGGDYNYGRLVAIYRRLN